MDCPFVECTSCIANMDALFTRKPLSKKGEATERTSMITATKADCIYKFECPKIELCFKHCHFIYTKCNYLKSKKNALKTNRYMFCYYC